MPKGPKGQRRPGDVISNAVHVMRIATGEITETPQDALKTAAAALGRKGGLARAKNLSKAEKIAIARKGGVALQKARAKTRRKSSMKIRPIT